MYILCIKLVSLCLNKIIYILYIFRLCYYSESHLHTTRQGVEPYSKYFDQFMCKINFNITKQTLKHKYLDISN